MVRAAATTSLAAVVWENTSPPLRPVPLTAHLVMRWPVALATKATAPDTWYPPGYWAVKRLLLVTLSWCPAGESRSSVVKVTGTKVALAMDWAAGWRTWQAGRSSRNRPGSRMPAFAVVVVSTPPAKSAKLGTVATRHRRIQKGTLSAPSRGDESSRNHGPGAPGVDPTTAARFHTTTGRSRLTARPMPSITAVDAPSGQVVGAPVMRTRSPNP